MSATIHDVADKAGVSISTVSRAFTHPEMVSAATRETVVKVANQLNFSISRSAAALKSGMSLRIALLLSDHSSTWFNATVNEGLNDVFHPAGYDLSIFQINSSQDRKVFFDTLPTRSNADAVIVNSFDVDDNEVTRLSSLHVPLVGINSASTNAFSASVSIDDSQGETIAVKHLISLGHRQLTYVQTRTANSLLFSVQRRKEAFMELCRKQSLPRPRIIMSSEPRNQVADIVSQIIAMDSLPTAIVCQEDSIAIPLIFQLRRSGVRVPEDISIIGFDDSTFAEDIGLTTIRQDPLNMAKLAAEMTLRLLNDERINMPQRVFTPQLILRSSTGSIRKGNPW
ncbi:MAG: LacI family DNA-binding transcriptional regulator [Bifidobacterium aquikefiri]|uniref:LacI family transcriptional regulator n=1 Tax=Bifidobacterium aquikefiri TaxID=1653207 RepID=A0A261G0J7_9BIFI|nr:LacI family DNA-binding transcriptional regulator [Bifidobacterium aquikefiri]OZG64964.1 LacI family transcriptional regulator [Bifidobacterium aquikefiri]